MKDLVIVGAGDFGREVSGLVERINAAAPTWHLVGFADDAPEKQGRVIDGYPVLGGIAYLEAVRDDIYMVCSVADCRIKKMLVERVLANHHVHAATLVDPMVIMMHDTLLGEGCIICAGTVITVNCTIGNHVMINLNCTLGHDDILDDYCTIEPGSNISGKVHLHEGVNVGTGTKITQGLSVAGGTVLGAGAVVVRDITQPGTYVGVPAKRVK